MRHFKCKRCGTAFEVGFKDKRKTGRCFQCGEPFNLPMLRTRVYGLYTLAFAAALLAIAALLYFR